jgi:hypothetical protein
LVESSEIVLFFLLVLQLTKVSALPQVLIIKSLPTALVIVRYFYLSEA